MSKYEKFDNNDLSHEASTSPSNLMLKSSDIVVMSNTSSLNGPAEDDSSCEPMTSTSSEVFKSGSAKSSSYEAFPSYSGSPDKLTFREKLRFFLEHLIFRLFSLFLILVDCTLMVIDLANVKKPNHEQEVYDVVALIFVVYFCIELGLRVYSQGAKAFFAYWYNTLDFVVILVSFMSTLTYVIMDTNGLIKLVILGRLIRVMVLVRLVRVVTVEPHNLQKGVRHVVSENKRRLRAGEFDLDMTYITKNVIGMSFPSSGKMALYRNNIKDVARYLDTYHGPGHYKVYNLCSEKSYDIKFFHESVARYQIDDHNVPTIKQMLDFAEDVKQFLTESDKNVIAVHCKGGKGRTGTMICAWLIYNGQFADSKDVLDFFGEKRTDKAYGSKFQGVETPSQARYVDYFNQVMNSLGGHIPAKRQLTLKNFKITSLLGIGAGDGSDLTCTISIDRAETFSLDFGSNSNCEVEYQPEQDILTVIPRNCPVLVGDVRLKFNCKTKSVPRAYEDCAFYFWFNTAFVDLESCSLKIKREDLDNPHKSKTWKLYREKFSVKLFFNELSPS